MRIERKEQVNNAFSKAAVWVIIALVLFTVFRQFEYPSFLLIVENALK